MNADILYEVSLLAALVIAGGAAVAGIASCWLSARVHRRAKHAARLTGIAALVLGACSFLLHLIAGHGASSPEPMTVLTFVSEHRAYLVCLALAVVGLVAAHLKPDVRNLNEPERKQES